MLSVKHNRNKSIREKDILEVVMLIKNFAGKNSSVKFDKDAIQRAVTNIIVKPAFSSNFEPHMETRQSDSEYDEEEVDDTKEGSRIQRNNEETEESSYSIADKFGKLHDGMTDDDTRGEDSWSTSEKHENDQVLKLDPSSHLHDHRQAKEGFRNATSGTVDKPIDIEKLLFEKNMPNLHEGHGSSRNYYSKSSEFVSMSSSME